MRRLAALAIVASLTACYNPDLGPNPFLCAASGKKCPDGYACQTRNNAQVCIKEGVEDGAVKVDKRVLTDAELMPSKEGPVFLDGAIVKPAPPSCLDQQSEPNNSAATATLLPGPGFIPNWEICYPGDVDQYAIPLKIGDRLIVRVKFTNSRGDLEAALTDPSGTVIDASRTTNNEEVVSLPVADKDGKYIVGVYGFGPAVNTYDLDITISGGH